MAYVVALPAIMTGIALYFSDSVALRWGPWALAAGPVVYLALQPFARQRKIE